MKLVKSRKSSSGSSMQTSKNKSPGKGSLEQASSSLGGESASATSMIYESQKNKGFAGAPLHNRSDLATSPSKSSRERDSYSLTPANQVKIIFNQKCDHFTYKYTRVKSFILTH